MHKYKHIKLAYMLGLISISAGFSAPSYAIIETPALDVFGSEQKVAAQTGEKLLPYSCPPLPQNGEKLDVMQTVNIALCHNPSTRATWFQLRSQAVSLNGTKVGQYVPNVSSGFSVNHSSVHADGQTNTGTSTSGSVSLSYVLFDFGVREASVEAAEKSLESAMTNYDSSLQGLIASTIQTYYSLLSAKYSLDAARDSLAFSEQTLNAAKARYELGLVAKIDVLQAESNYSSSQVSLEQAENTYQQTHHALMVIMGVEPETDVAIADVDESQFAADDFDMEVKELVEIAKRERLDLKAQEKSLESSYASLEATKRSNLPRVSMSASQNYSNAFINDFPTQASGTLGFSVSIPIFDGFTRAYSIKSNELSIKSQQIGIERTKLSIAQDVWSAYNNYQTARNSWMASFDALASAAEFRDIALGRYKAGVGSQLDVQNANATYTRALSSYINSRFSMLTSRVNLIRAVGVLNLQNADATTPLARIE